MSASSSYPPTFQAIWEAAGRPGVEKFASAVKRAGLRITGKQAKEFVAKQAVSQVFQPAPRSTGRVSASQRNERWQADLLDYKTKDPEDNNGYRAVLVAIDIFSRMLYAEPLKTKTQVEVTAAFQKILSR